MILVPKSPLPSALDSGLPDGVNSAFFTSERHTSRYLAAGDQQAPVVLFCHGWPEQARSWSYVLPRIAAAGYYAVAPDMRGYGGSTVHPQAFDYRHEEVFADMLELATHLGVSPERPMVIVGHDYGAPIAWNFALHRPDILHGVVGMSVPYLPSTKILPSGVDKSLYDAQRTPFGVWEHAVASVDRSVYPADKYPVGQWDYQLAHAEMPEDIAASLNEDVAGSVASVFRRGSDAFAGKPLPTAAMRSQGRWFAGTAPTRVPDPAVLSACDFDALVAGLERNGFAPANAWYRNNASNDHFAAQGVTEGRITVPALFVCGRYDHVTGTLTTPICAPMRSLSNDLTEVVLESGHWMAQERPKEVAEIVLQWMSTRSL